MPLRAIRRSEEHTSELQSRSDLVCRLLLEKKQIPGRSTTGCALGRRARRRHGVRRTRAAHGRPAPRRATAEAPRAAVRVLQFFFNDTATTEIYTLSLHDALPIFQPVLAETDKDDLAFVRALPLAHARSEEHTSELQSRSDLVCRLLLEKKNWSMHFVHAMLLSGLVSIIWPSGPTQTQEASFFFFFNDPAPTEIYSLSLPDALPIWQMLGWRRRAAARPSRWKRSRNSNIC